MLSPGCVSPPPAHPSTSAGKPGVPLLVALAPGGSLSPHEILVSLARPSHKERGSAELPIVELFCIAPKTGWSWNVNEMFL